MLLSVFIALKLNEQMFPFQTSPNDLISHVGKIKECD